MPGEGWEYVFYVEVSGHMTDRTLVAALEGVKREAKTLKIIGSFPLEHPDPPQPESDARR
jgi:chorismate mutase/prephenate dehydratase